MTAADVTAKTLVLVPAALLLVVGLDVGGLRAPLSAAVVGSAEAVAQPVADALLERLPWPGPRDEPGRRDEPSERDEPAATCVFGPYEPGDPCGQPAT